MKFKKRIPKQSGKESANDTPDWVRGKPSYKDETPEQYALRLIKKNMVKIKFYKIRKKAQDQSIAELKEHGEAIRRFYF